MKKQAGFTIIELLVVIAIVGILLSFTTLNLLHAQHATSLSTAEESLIADMKSQQAKAMNGTGGGGAFGVHFSSNNTYTLFQGTSFTPPGSPVTINDAISFTDSSDVVFSAISGQTTATTITVKNTASNEIKTIKLNKYGVVRQE